MKRLFSGMQPTGELHIGNYIGALKNWTTLLDGYDCLFCVVDLHALTIPYDRDALRERVLGAVADYIAGGLDPERCSIFVQSHVPEHTELTWILNTVTPLGQLMRMTQFKAKTAQFTKEENIIETGDPDIDRSAFLQKAGSVNSGLFTYPVLMAADILLYKALVVPVGEDQIQHVELTRDIARRFNNRWKGPHGDLFPDARPLLSHAGRLMGLDGQNKMSKSTGNHISMNTAPEEIVRRITREAVSDPARVKRHDPGTPEVCNVYAWHKAFSPEADQTWAAEGCRSAGIGCFECKKRVAEHIAAELAPYRERRAELAKHPDDLMDVLGRGAKVARGVAQQTMSEVREALGFVPRPD